MNGSVNKIVQNGGPGVQFLLSNGIIMNHTLGSGSIASDFTSEV